MKIGKLLSLPLLLTLLFSACAQKPLLTAEHAAVQAEARTYYVAPSFFASLSFPLPPAEESMEQQADLAGVLAWQNKRTEEDCARALRTAREEYDAYWGESSPFGPEVPAEFKEFFDRVASDFERALDVMKGRFRRPRPFVNNPEVEPCLKRKKTFSYPSGHASASRVTAAVLADIVPGRREEFFLKADGVALDRVVAGLHYPSDIAAGKRFGDIFHEELMKSGDYRREVDRIKALVK